MPYTDSHGIPVGETIFVAVRCGGHIPLGFCWQQPPFWDSGVARNASVYNDFLESHENFDINLPIESTPFIDCQLGHAPFDKGQIWPGCHAGLPPGIPLGLPT